MEEGQLCAQLAQQLGQRHLVGNPLFARSAAAAFAQHYAPLLAAAQRGLLKRGFAAAVYNTEEEARQAVTRLLQQHKPAAVGVGNSQTLRALGVPAIAQKTAAVYAHNPRHHSPEGDRRALLAGVYFTSANALSTAGEIVNIDGTGNRTAATCYGPRRVVFVVGRNKVCRGLAPALRRAKQAAIRLAALYQRATPCATTSLCHNCAAPQCVCGVTTVHRKQLMGNHITVLLVNRPLGL